MLVFFDLAEKGGGDHDGIRWQRGWLACSGEGHALFLTYEHLGVLQKRAERAHHLEEGGGRQVGKRWKKGKRPLRRLWMGLERCDGKMDAPVSWRRR